MSKTDKTDPLFVKALRGESVTIDHDHRNGICDAAVRLWGPRDNEAPRDWRVSMYACEIHVNYYSYPGRKAWSRPKRAKYETEKWHRAKRREANVKLSKGEEPEPLRTRHWVLWDLD